MAAGSEFARMDAPPRGFSSLVAVTPNDGVDLDEIAQALWIGGAGAVRVRPADPDTGDVTLTAVPAGTLLPVRVTRVLATGTTATAIVALR